MTKARGIVVTTMSRVLRQPDVMAELKNQREAGNPYEHAYVEGAGGGTSTKQQVFYMFKRLVLKLVLKRIATGLCV